MPNRMSEDIPNRMSEDLPDKIINGMNWMPWWGSFEVKSYLIDLQFEFGNILKNRIINI